MTIFKTRSIPLIFSLAISAVLALVACGGSDEGGVRPTTPSSATTVEAEDPSATLLPMMAIDLVVAPEAGTVTNVLALQRPVIIAHAGGNFDWPHSTMYAFTQAALAGADVLEMDVMLSADDVLMVQHDNTVDRLTNNSGLFSSYTSLELQAMDNAYWFSGGVWSDKSLEEEAYIYRGVRTGIRDAPEGFTAEDFAIPTFEQVARAFPNHVLDIEIKIPESESGEILISEAYAAAKELARLIVELGRQDSVIVVSFNDEVLVEFRSLIADVATSPGQTSLVNWYLTGSPLDQRDVVIQAPPIYEGLEVLTKETFDRAHTEGYDVWVWMSDGSQENTEYYQDLLNRGADGLLISSPLLVP